MQQQGKYSNCLENKISNEKICLEKCPNFIRTIGRHLDNLMKWLVRMGNTGVWGNDPSICKRKKMQTKKVESFKKVVSFLIKKIG